MRLLPAIAAGLTVVAVVIGANAVTGERGAEPGPAATESKGSAPPAQDDFIHGYDPECVDEPAEGESLFIPLECMRLPGQPDKTPLGWKPHPECEPELKELEPESCEDTKNLLVPDFGATGPRVTINGQVVALPPDVLIAGPGIGDPVVSDATPDPDATPWVGWTTVKSGNSWVKYTTDGRLLDSHVAPGDDSKFQALLDALRRE